MKKLFLLAVFFFLNITLFSAEIDSCYAKIIGRNFFEEFTNQTNTTINNIVENKYNFVTTFYAINFKEGGFILISADDRVSPVISISNSGLFTEISQFIPPKQTIFNNYSAQIYELILNGI
ncbi:MAG: Spi family protease inhibitor [Bacteroidales bacterium]|nr:Spi family protease inhibitor [Bacteroidales bacterium]